MIQLIAALEEKFRVALFHVRYKILNNEGLSPDERFVQAIVESSDDKIRLEDHQELIKKWLNEFGKVKK